MFIKILLIGAFTFNFKYNVYALDDKDSEKYEDSKISSLIMTPAKTQENTLLTDEEFSSNASSTPSVKDKTYRISKRLSG
jgi:hypothetical protein